MRYLMMLMLGFAGILSLAAQDMSYVDDDIESELKEMVNRKKATLEKEFGSAYLNREKIIEFKLDTFRIETELDLKLARTESMFDQELALNDAVYAYNRLVGKYVDLLGNLLNEQDKQTLKQSQMSWLEYKRHEFRMIESMARLDYPEGRKMDNLYITRRVKEMNKSRVAELFRYYMFMAGK